VIAIVDPAVFRADDTNGLEKRVRELLELLRATGAHLPEPSEAYWIEIDARFLAAIRTHPSRSLKFAIQELQRHTAMQIAPLPDVHAHGEAWGFNTVFAWAHSNDFPLEHIEELLIRCILHELPVFVVSADVDGLNCSLVTHGDSAPIVVRNVWQITVRLNGRQTRIVEVLRSIRNLQVTWTQRYDEDLPSDDLGGSYPYCPPKRWWLRTTSPDSVTDSKPGFRDYWGNGWTRPTQGGSEHWDVHIHHPDHLESVGLQEINVLSFGQSNGVPGDIHHMPKKKKAKFRQNSSWSCEDCGERSVDMSGTARIKTFGDST